ncbi:hypothetical protein HN51_013155 [Arachis hypogaea]|uniref:F-box domain-containing protein n=1 Tax=Arachis hypogaea TaxID=3818 RepID=A0A445DRG7_ARAHY|nr:F-box protein At1g61340 [Arachis hypogaea]XP_057748135.1 F-box protein At1g61340-like [Arachis stenosperma]QHO58815.1 F-box protein [Arachis hypogaea]RYR65776.1 hypothetical protein Ahy_A03g011696 isoform A [Arachis hypogaea]
MAIGFEGYNFTRTRSLGRKRVVSGNVEGSPLDSETDMAPLKRVCSGRFNFNSERSLLEALPLDILIRVLCGVDHEDLEQLLHVSKTISEAAEVAKRFHFEYSTPKKKTFDSFHSSINFNDAKGFEEIVTPKAPLRKSKSRLNSGKLASISVALFASDDEQY